MNENDDFSFLFSVLGWFAAVIILNEKRTGPRYESEAISKVTSTDGKVY